MFQAFFCGDNFALGNGGALCDGSDDGSYTVRILASDKAQPENNVATLDYSFVLDVTPPVVGFGGITGLNASNAATVDFVLDAFVVDRNGDGTAVTSAVVQVTGITGGGGCFGGEDLITEAQVQVTPEGGNDDSTGNTVIADVHIIRRREELQLAVVRMWRLRAEFRGGSFGAAPSFICQRLTCATRPLHAPDLVLQPYAAE
jgi:hypothetical protein